MGVHRSDHDVPDPMCISSVEKRTRGLGDSFVVKVFTKDRSRRERTRKGTDLVDGLI